MHAGMEPVSTIQRSCVLDSYVMTGMAVNSEFHPGEAHQHRHVLICA